MTILSHLVIAVACFAVLVAPAHTLYKVTLTNPDAVCLDGTPGAYFIREGDRRKILLYFEGGGWCGSYQGINETLDNCYQRTNMFLGSSIYYPNQMTYSQGIFSDHPKNIFRDWTLVHLKYCDGGGHQGYRKEPVDFYGFKLYFRGHNITIAQLESVDKSHKLFSQATQIVVSGQSAGGLATYMWSNYIAQRASKQANVWAVPDSGIFLNFQNYTSKRYDYKDKFMNLMTFTNAEVDPPNQECVRAHPTQKSKCMFAEYMHEHVRVPLFAINSLYDSWSIAYLLYMNCGVKGSLKNCDEDKIKFIEEYKRNTSVIVESIARRPQNGAWAPACSNHVYTMSDKFYSEDYRIPQETRNSVVHSLYSWIYLQGRNNRHVDRQSWPANGRCSGLN